MASRCRDVLYIEDQGGGNETGGLSTGDPVMELLVELHAIRGLVTVAMGFSEGQAGRIAGRGQGPSLGGSM